VCRVCCGPVVAPETVCFVCRWTAARLRLPLAPVVPVRLCPLPGPLYTVLLGYKEAPATEARGRFAGIVRVLTDEFLAVHARCLAAVTDGRPDMILPVPSTARPDGSPLGRVPGLADAVARRFPGATWAPEVLTRGPAPVAHMRPDRAAFAVTAASGPMEGSRVLLLDDTYVSGARSQSAAAALRLVGVRAVVILVLGRVLRPDRSAQHADFLAGRRLAPARAGARTAPAIPRCSRCVQTAARRE
jgi:hypothetical protein